MLLAVCDRARVPEFSGNRLRMNNKLNAKIEALLRDRRLEPASAKLTQRIVQKAFEIPRTKTVEKLTRFSSSKTKGQRFEEDAQMKMKIFAQAAAVAAVGWAVSATAPVLADTLTDPLMSWSVLPRSFEAGTDPDDVLADRFLAIIDGNLAIKFALSDGAEPDNVDIVIKNSTGKQVVETRSDGALLFTKLPEGDYSIEATWRGKTIKRDVTLSSLAQSKVALTWDDEGSATDRPAAPNESSQER